MATVDNRIVHMTFDNAQFERNIAQTMASMEKMKQSLNFSGAQNSFAELNRAASGFHLGGIAAAVDNISSKFTALGATAFSVIANITSRVVDAGLQMAKKFTVGPIIDGFHEMETNMNSIQTILANTESKGSTLDDVNSALNQLNEYSDQTIYNFSQMAKNIGTFTAAGVDLDTSVGAIKGIANLAAISGSNADQASSAMYQLSQALASGSVKLMDWNSIVNAGMGGEVFQKALFETGKSLGTIEDIPLDQTFDQWKDAGNSFRGSLEEGWLTAEVLTNTLQGFTGDLDAAQLKALGYTDEQVTEMLRLGKLGKAAATEVKTLTQLLGTVKESVGSGWSKSFQLIFGDFEEAKSLFTGLSETIGAFVGKQSDARNELLQGWKDLGGRTLLIEALKDAFQGLATIIRPIRDAFKKIFPPATAETLFNLTQRFADFTEKISVGMYTAKRIETVFKGVFSIIAIGIEIVKETAKAFANLFDRLRGDATGSGILNFFVELARKIIDLKTFLVDEGGIQDFFASIGDFFEDPLPALQGFVDKIKGAFEEIKSIFLFGDFKGVGPWAEDSPIIDGFFKLRDKIIEIFDGIDLSKVLDKLTGFFESIFGIDIDLPDGLVKFFESFGENVDDNTTNSLAGGFERLGDRLGTLWEVLKKVWDVLTDVGNAAVWVYEQFKDFVGFIGDAFQAIFDFAKNIGPNLQKAFMSEEFDRFLDFLDSVGILLGGAGIAGISKNGLKVDVTGGSLTRLSELFKDLSGTLPSVKKNIEGLTGVFSAMQTEIKANALMKIAIAIGILTASMVVLSMIDPDALAKALGAMAVGFGQLVGAMALLSKMSAGPTGAANLTALATGMIMLSTAVLILSAAVAVLAQLSWEELAKGMAGVTAILLVMIGAAKLMQGNTASLIAAGVGMVAIGVALNLIGASMLIFSSMSWEELGKGMAAIAAALLIIAGALQLMPASAILIGPGLVAVAIALNLIAAAVMIFATMSWKDIGKGMAALAASLLIIAGGLALMGPSVLLIGPGLIAVAIALNILAGALLIFASMSWEEIGKSMAALAGSLLILAGAMALMSGGLAGAIAVGVMAASLMLLVNVLKEFAGMKLKDLGKGLLAMALALGAIALLALALQPAIGAIFALGIALAALGVAFVLFGVGASLIAEAFQIIAAAGTAGIDVLMYAIDQLLMRLPEMARSFAEGIIMFAQMILDAAPKLIEGLGKVLASLLDALILLIPKLRDTAIAYIDAILTVFIESVPKLVKAGFALLMGLLHGIEDNIQEIAITVGNIIVNLVNGLADRIPDLVTAGLTMLVAFLDGISQNLQQVIDAGVDILVNLLVGIAKNIDDVATAVGEIITALIDAIEDLHGDILDAGTDAIIEFLAGLTSNTREIITAAGDFIVALMDALADEAVNLADSAFVVLTEFLNGLAEVIRTRDNELRDAGWNLADAIMDGVLEGIDELGGKIKDKLVDLAEEAWEEVKDFWKVWSPSRKFIWLGEMLMLGWAGGIENESKAPMDSIDVVGDDIVSSMQKSLSKIPDAIKAMPEFAPTITPVLDLTSVKSTAGQLNGLLNNNTIGADVSLDQARLIAAGAAQRTEETPINPADTTPKAVKFEQNIYSPTPINTATVYRQTRNQIELAKKELAIP